MGSLLSTIHVQNALQPQMCCSACRDSGKGVTLCGLHIEGCRSSAIWVHGNSTGARRGPSAGLRLLNSKFAHNHNAKGTGGDVSASHTRLGVCGCEFLNSSASQGGSLALLQSQAKIASSIFANAAASAEGGAIHALGSGTSLNMIGTTFQKARAAALGGAVMFQQGAFRAVGCTFEDVQGGTAVYAVLPRSFSIKSSQFLRCNGGSQAGGIVLVMTGAKKPLQAYLEDVTIANCSASRHGGALYAESTSGELPVLFVKNSLITGCKVSNGLDPALCR